MGEVLGILHIMETWAEYGPLVALQSQQRDWSPFLAHFTSWAAMAPLRSAVDDRCTPQDFRRLLIEADRQSFEVVQAIAGTNRLLAKTHPREPDLPSRVCLSESTLPGLIGLAERYGRFGFVFGKDEIHAAGGRPCVYVEEEAKGRLHAELSPFGPTGGCAADLLAPLANTYRPAGARPQGSKGIVQDFTHEREWRMFRNLQFEEIPPRLILVPNEDYQAPTYKLFNGIAPCVSLKLLHAWGI